MAQRSEPPGSGVLAPEIAGAARQARDLAGFLLHEGARLESGRLARGDASDLIERVSTAYSAFRGVSTGAAVFDLVQALVLASGVVGETPFEIASRGAILEEHIARWPGHGPILTDERFESLATALAGLRPGRPRRDAPAFWPALQAILIELKLSATAESSEDLAKRIRPLLPRPANAARPPPKPGIESP